MRLEAHRPGFDSQLCTYRPGDLELEARLRLPPHL